MINVSYRLTSPKQIRAELIEEELKDDDIIVRPSYLSICAADERYYTGNRDKETLNKKLPMALIHEAVGTVLHDPKDILKKGTKVVLIPNTPTEKDEVIKENYLRSSYFKSSGYDGFMQNLVLIDRNRVIPYENLEDKIAVLFELMSVAMNALEHFSKYSHTRKQTIGVWGCGNVGLITALVLKKTYKDSKIIVFGTTEQKLSYFSFADETYLVDKIPENLRVDHAFECVGGLGSEKAINQIIDIINPEGSIALMGVNENKVPINTRMVLEKGLTLLGNSRSGYNDFMASINFIKNNPDCKDYLINLISDEVVVKNINDIHKAFDKDLVNEFKTIMKWEI